MNLIWEVSLTEFTLVTLVLGGLAAWMTGRAVALTWGSWLRLAVYIALLSLAVRFIHYSLFGGTFFLPPAGFATGLHYYVVDFIALMLIAAAARQMNRSHQMSEQYSFLYDRSGPFGWKPRV
ncbi:hypothetical protein J2R99_002710 [Rhodopseudomonas julia]|uniref:DUF6867 domain-containing protein n=1 Tax=Rhodopseudomonas julia TaxID=200617 RepID=A0ABU0CAB8_9BRAD|nr:hypothetical protein [Rhodopseudomonas julia]MDQ0326841.1 hypothetical protein [Rhodopseudomonas julia]